MLLNNFSKQSQRARDLWRYGLTLCIILAFVLMVWGSVLLWRAFVPETHWFSISRIKIVTDARHLSTREIAVEAADHLDGGFFSLNIAELRKLLLRHPWVKSVAFSRQWPDMLQIRVVEQKPMAIWCDQFLLNSEGQIFSPPQQQFPQNLPQLSGPESSLALVLQQYARLSKQLAPLQLSINELHLDDDQSWSFMVKGIRVMLGKESMDQRIARFITLYQRIISKNKQLPLRVDLRYPDGASVKW